MTSRERGLTALSHKEPDRIPIDLGGMWCTTIAVSAYSRLRKYLNLPGDIRIWSEVCQLAEVDDKVRDRAGIDTKPVWLEPEKWKAGALPDGSSCLVNENWNPERLADGSQVLRDETGEITFKMPEDGYYFDKVGRSYLENAAIGECLEKIDRFSESLEKETDWNKLGEKAKSIYENTGYLIVGNIYNSIFETGWDFRGLENWLVDLAADEKFTDALLDKILEMNIRKLKHFLKAVGPYIQVIATSDDLGAQNSLLLSPRVYRKMIKPRQKKLYEFIKENTDAYIFLHCCGAISGLIPDFIEIGVDILNPVQVSAEGMDTAKLKKAFGKDITFWGGGCDTQKVLPFGTPEDVKKEVRKRIEDLAHGGGFVFSQVHDIQANTPPENIMAMYETVLKYGKY